MQEGFRQCSQMRGTKNMKLFSYSNLIEMLASSRSFFTIGSSSPLSAIPPSASSQFAEALIATAMGLFAAIPAVVAFNRFSTKVEKLENAYINFMDEFSTILNRQLVNKGDQ